MGISKELSDADYEELKQIFSAWAAENEANRPVDDDDEDYDPALIDIPEKAEAYEIVGNLEESIEAAEEDKPE
ncbi:MAG: hypothetical protein GX853_00910 [Chloroflexi bacterium]|nr:hypothetical protein [Chloroflexota bacterium]